MNNTTMERDTYVAIELCESTDILKTAIDKEFRHDVKTYTYEEGLY